MWPRMSHTLAPLTGLTYIKRKVKWTQVEKYAFDEIERIASHITLLTYMYFNETFKMYTNARAIQLGGVIGQKEKTYPFIQHKTD